MSSFVPTYLTSALLLAIVCGTLVTVAYNLWFHPLRSYPGPILARCSLAWRFWHSMNGRFHRAIEEQHKKHGPVFRVSPNELSFSSVASWKAIYGNPLAGALPCIKSEFYDVFGAGHDSKCIGSERDPKRHAAMKKHLNPAFSTRALIEQESIIRRCADGMMDKLHKLGGTENGLNMVHWYEMIAFDILGEMAFGETFHCIENEEPHFWFEMLTKHLFVITLIDNLRRYPFAMTIGKLLSPLTGSIQEKNTTYTHQLVEKRLRDASSRRDFLTNLVEQVKAGNVEREELNAHTSTLVIAGGETVSSFLAATTFYLCTNPAVMTKLKDEIRNRYKSVGEIDASTSGQLQYLQAVIQEGLRIFPPGSQGFPRISSGIEVEGRWVPAGTEIYTSAWTVTHDPQNFSEPNSFIPERWLDANNKDVKEASQPFSLGLRACIGRNFALVEASLILCLTLFQFDMVLVNPHQQWEELCHMHINWWKPEMRVRFLPVVTA